MNRLLLLSLIVLLAGCIQQGQHDSGKLKVVATFYPLYDFAKNVGGERVEVVTLIPPGVEPHEFEPTPSAIKQLADADVVIYNGAGMEPWLPKLLEAVDNKKLIAVDTSSGMELLSSQNSDEPGNDPHIWLDPVLAKKQVEDIRDAFIRADPAGKEYYERNAAAYSAKLDSLDAKFRATMASCKKRDILVTHATLAYFCKEYGCNQIPITGINPEAEPSPGDLANIIRQAKEKSISVVFFESLINPKSAQTIADEIGGRVSSFNSVHGLTAEEKKNSDDYISLMEGNAGRLSEALECN